jgi:hypothetical protein
MSPPYTCRALILANAINIPFATWLTLRSLVVLPTARGQSPFLCLFLIALQHTLHEIAQRAPKVFAAIRKTMLINEQHVVLEARIQVRLQSQLNDDRVVVAVNVRVNTVEALEHVANEGRKCLRERDTDAAGKHLLVIDVRLYPCHEMFDILGGGHFRGSLVVFTVLPEVLESTLHQKQSSEQFVRAHTRLSLSSQDSSVASRIR